MIIMWLSGIENRETVKGVYKEKEPSLSNITIYELVISTGEDLMMVLIFDTDDMPNDIPIKWKEGKFNTVRFVLNFVNINIKFMGLNNKNYKHLNLVISDLENGTKEVIGKDRSGNYVFEIEANWIYIKSISGYNNHEVTD